MLGLLPISRHDQGPIHLEHHGHPDHLDHTFLYLVGLNRSIINHPPIHDDHHPDHHGHIDHLDRTFPNSEAFCTCSGWTGAWSRRLSTPSTICPSHCSYSSYLNTDHHNDYCHGDDGGGNIDTWPVVLDHDNGMMLMKAVPYSIFDNDLLFVW